MICFWVKNSVSSCEHNEFRISVVLTVNSQLCGAQSVKRNLFLLSFIQKCVSIVATVPKALRFASFYWQQKIQGIFDTGVHLARHGKSQACHEPLLQLREFRSSLCGFTLPAEIRRNSGPISSIKLRPISATCFHSSHY